MAADETTEKFSEVMDELIAAVSKAEAERDALAARVFELENEVELALLKFDNCDSSAAEYLNKHGPWINTCGNCGSLHQNANWNPDAEADTDEFAKQFGPIICGLCKQQPNPIEQMRAKETHYPTMRDSRAKGRKINAAQAKEWFATE